MNGYAVIAAIVLAAAGGWVVRGWSEDSAQLAVEKAAKLIDDKAIVRESALADLVETRLAQLKANEKIIDRGIIREIEKPIYQRVCLEPGAIRLLNAAARGEAATDTSEPVDAVPGASGTAK